MNMLRHFYNDFMAFVPLQLPQLLDVTTMEEPQFYGDYVLLTFPLRTPYSWLRWPATSRNECRKRHAATYRAWL